MRTVSGTRSLDIGRNAPFLAYPDIGQNILLVTVLTVFVIEVGTKEKYGIIFKDRIDTDNILFF